MVDEVGQRGDEGFCGRGGAVDQEGATGRGDRVEGDDAEHAGFAQVPVEQVVAQAAASARGAPGEQVDELALVDDGGAGWQFGERVEGAAAVARGERAAQFVGEGGEQAFFLVAHAGQRGEAGQV